ncbi:MAG: prolyl oligopeptidase family serine peptidase [Phycisphaerae bacterium]|nr:prolyl oligopeptidase family serine peptidase [Phycisphaerae bacterium]
MMLQRPARFYRFLVLWFCLCTTISSAQVYKARIRAQWFDNNQKFWYRNDLANDATEFVLVDTDLGTRSPAFDHGRVAAMLSDQTGKSVDAAHLPIRSLAFSTDGQTVGLRGPDATWQLTLDTYALTKVDASDQDREGLPFTKTIRPSGANGPETSITFVNQLTTPVKLFWIDPQGERQPYGIVEAGQQKNQHTFTNHRWLVTDENDAVLAVFTAVEDGGRAMIDGSEPQEERRARGRRGGRSGPQTVTSPDGQWTPFVRDHNLWLRHTVTLKERQLSADGTSEDSYHRDASRARLVGMQYDRADFPDDQARVIWSPDSKYVVALKTHQVAERRVYMVESSPKDQLQPKLHSYPYLKAGDDIPVGLPHLFHVDTQQEVSLDTTLFANPWDIDNIQWAPDSSHFLFLFNQRGHQAMRVISVEAATGDVRPLVNEECETFFDYSNKQFLQVLTDTQELIWMSERSGWNHLYLYDTRTGQVKNPITQGQWVVRGVDRVDTEKRQIWFRAMGFYPDQDPYLVHYARVDFDGRNLCLLTHGNGTHSIEYSPNQRFYIDTYARADHPPVHELRKTEDGTLVCDLEQADASELLASGRTLPEPFVAKGRDGTTNIYGLIHRPLNFDPSQSYPIIEAIYAGPHGAFVPKSFQASSGQWAMADLGFIVVQIDGMGTNWRSRAFHDLCWKNIVDAGFPDRVLWIKAAAKQYPYMDLNRVGIYGGSAGGQNSLGALLTHGDFYKVAVSDCGCHDNRMDKIWWNEQWMGYPVGPHYAAQSNVTLAKNLTGKLLLVVGELDRNVDPASSMQVVNALIQADKDFDLLVVPGAGHGATGTAYGRRRLRDYFVEHLLRDEG